VFLKNDRIIEFVFGYDFNAPNDIGDVFVFAIVFFHPIFDFGQYFYHFFRWCWIRILWLSILFIHFFMNLLIFNIQLFINILY